MDETIKPVNFAASPHPRLRSVLIQLAPFNKIAEHSTILPPSNKARIKFISSTSCNITAIKLWIVAALGLISVTMRCAHR